MSKLEPVRENTSISTLSIQSIRFKSPNELFHGLADGLYPVKFDDGVVLQLTKPEIVINNFVYKVLNTHRYFGIKSAHSITNYYVNNMFNGKSISKMFSNILKDIYYNYIVPIGSYDKKGFEIYWEIMFQIISDLRNFSFSVGEYVSSFDIVDLIEITDDEVMMDAMAIVAKEMTPSSIDVAYKTLDKFLRSSKMKDNPMAILYVGGMVNPNQVKQILGPRGYITNIDSEIYKYPITKSFTDGLDNMYYLLIESRAAAKAMLQSTTAIRESENTARHLQLAGMSITHIEVGDCGSTGTIDVTIGEDDLHLYAGKNYVDDDGTLKTVYATDKHLIGKTINIRSVLRCQHHNPHVVCSTCFGELHHQIPWHMNLGHYCSTSMTAQVSQMILSTKHLTTSANSGAVKLCNTGKKFFRVRGSEYFVKNKGTKLMIPVSEAYGVSDIKPGIDINKINKGRISSITGLSAVNGSDWGFIEVLSEGRKGNLTPEFIKYMVEHGTTVSQRDEYVVDLSEWDIKQPFMSMQDLEFSFAAFSSAITKLVTRRNRLKNGRSSDRPEELVAKLFDLVNSKLNVNIALLETIVYAFTVADPNDDVMNYNLGRVTDPSKYPKVQLGNIKTVISKRSLSAAYAFADVTWTLLNPASFDGRNRPDHLMDVVIDPNAVTNNWLKIQKDRGGIYRWN